MQFYALREGECNCCVSCQVARLGKVQFCLFIQPAVDSIIRALEQAVFTVFHKFLAECWRDSGTNLSHVPGRHDNAATDVVLSLYFGSRDKVLTQLECSPTAFVQSNSQVGSNECSFTQFQFMAW